MSAPCGSCGAPIVWVVMQPSGKRMPVDLQESTPAERPVLAARWDGRRVVCRALTTREKDDYNLALPPGEHYVRSHFASCPKAATHRKKSRP